MPFKQESRQQVQQFIETNFLSAFSNDVEQLKAVFSKPVIDQLVWLQQGQLEAQGQVYTSNQTAFTNSATISSTPLHPEIPRAASRFYNLYLFNKQANEQGYSKFIGPQTELVQQGLLESNHVLKPGSYKSLCEFYKGGNDAEYNALVLNAVITKTPEAVKILKAQTGLEIADSVDFLFYSLQTYPQIYPLAAVLLQKTPETQVHLKNVCLLVATKRTSLKVRAAHLRHMGYDEGGIEKYQDLIEAIKKGLVTQTMLISWIRGWLANIAGMDGGIGSYYLDQRKFDRILRLITCLFKLCNNPDYQIQSEYLDGEADYLNLPKTNGEQQQARLTLSSLACSLRLFTPAEGQALNAGFNKLSAKWKAEIFSLYERARQQGFERTPTYLPLLFQNVFLMLQEQNKMHLLKVSSLEEARKIEATFSKTELDHFRTELKKLRLEAIEKTVALCLPIYSQAMKKYAADRKSGLIPNIPLNFNSVSSREGVAKLIAMTDSSQVEFEIDPSSGVLKVQIIAAQELLKRRAETLASSTAATTSRAASSTQARLSNPTFIGWARSNTESNTEGLLLPIDPVDVTLTAVSVTAGDDAKPKTSSAVLKHKG